jgi:hypothetical protein
MMDCFMEAFKDEIAEIVRGVVKEPIGGKDHAAAARLTKADAAWCIVAGMSRLPFYNKTEWQTARRQALHDSGYRC